MALTNEQTKFTDFEDISTFATPAFNGAWLCSKVQSCPENGWSTAGCLRFLPKEVHTTLADVRFTSGEVKVITYLTEPAEDSAEYENYLKTKTNEGKAEMQD